MTTRVTAGLSIVQAVAERIDPTEPVAVGEISRMVGMTLSAASRLCSELESAGLLERGSAYGTYRLGRVAISLSGIAAAPFARAVRYALTFAAQQTGQTVCLAARSGDALRVVASVNSAWTLYSPAAVGELVDDPRSAMVRAARLHNDDTDVAEPPYFESVIGMSCEVAAPVMSASGECIAVLAIRLPVNRSDEALPRVRHALAVAKRSLENTVETWLDEPSRAGVTAPAAQASEAPSNAPSAIEAAVLILRHLAAAPDSIAGTARATGLRQDRTQRLIDSCRRAGFVVTSPDRGSFHLGWILHGWYRASSAPLMVERGKPLVAHTAETMRACGFITVLRGMRSYTLVEELEMAGEGLEMTPWLGRAHPIIGSDGGPTLVMDLSAEEIALLFPARHSPQELDRFLRRVRKVMRDGVLTMEAFEDSGIVSVSAPVRDSSGTVVAAACLVGTTAYVRDNQDLFEDAARDLAAKVSALLV